jgi:hypothetical protein
MIRVPHIFCLVQASSQLQFMRPRGEYAAGVRVSGIPLNGKRHPRQAVLPAPSVPRWHTSDSAVCLCSALCMGMHGHALRYMFIFFQATMLKIHMAKAQQLTPIIDEISEDRCNAMDAARRGTTSLKLIRILDGLVVLHRTA